MRENDFSLFVKYAIHYIFIQVSKSEVGEKRYIGQC